MLGQFESDAHDDHRAMTVRLPGALIHDVIIGKHGIRMESLICDIWLHQEQGMIAAEAG
jgi:hypothetical protein